MAGGSESITLFEPTVRDMYYEHPELEQYEEFADLTFRQLKFCWYMGNKTSPLLISGLKKEERHKKAVKLAFGRLKDVRDDVGDLARGHIPPNMKDAIKKMAEFDVTTRMRAKFMTEYIFDKLNEIITVDEKVFDMMDFEEKKKYSELAIKISESFPDMIKRIESGFGIKRKAESKKGEIKVGIKNL